MIKINLVLLNLFFLPYCTFPNFFNDIKKENSNALRCVEISQTFPQISLDGQIAGFDTPRIHIFYFQNLVMYKIPYFYSEDTIENEKRYFYFVWKKGVDLGIRYNYDITPPEKFKVDSIIKNFWPNEMGMANRIKNKDLNISLKSTTQTENGKVLEFDFDGVRDNIHLTGKTLLYYSTEFNNLDFSFSREIDTVKNMKLYKIKNLDDSKVLPQYNFTLDAMETYYKIEECKQFDQMEILNIFEMFKKDNS